VQGLLLDELRDRLLELDSASALETLEFLESICSRGTTNRSAEGADVRSRLQIELILRSLSQSSGNRRVKASQ